MHDDLAGFGLLTRCTDVVTHTCRRRERHAAAFTTVTRNDIDDLVLHNSISCIGKRRACHDAHALVVGKLALVETACRHFCDDVQLDGIFGTCISKLRRTHGETGQWTAFPLSDHTGQYQISVYINVVDSKYAVLLSLTTNVALADEFAPFLYPNQYVNFGAAPNTVAMAASLTAGMTAPLDKVASVYHYVVGNLTYDHELAATVTSGYLPDLDAVLAKGSGICFDYAALMTGMLRSQGVPTKLVIGYAGDVYHAWINVWSESEGWVDGVIHFDGFSWKLMDPTFASSGGSDLMGFISNSANYTAKYIY